MTFIFVIWSAPINLNLNYFPSFNNHLILDYELTNLSIHVLFHLYWYWLVLTDLFFERLVLHIDVQKYKILFLKHGLKWKQFILLLYSYIFKHLWMVNAFDNIIKRQIIFVAVHKIGSKTISSDSIENSLMIYHCLL